MEGQRERERDRDRDGKVFEDVLLLALKMERGTKAKNAGGFQKMSKVLF